MATYLLWQFDYNCKWLISVYIDIFEFCSDCRVDHCKWNKRKKFYKLTKEWDVVNPVFKLPQTLWRSEKETSGFYFTIFVSFLPVTKLNYGQYFDIYFKYEACQNINITSYFINSKIWELAFKLVLLFISKIFLSINLYNFWMVHLLNDK